jgi:hypothetical protein
MATIRSEGGLLPADILARIAALDPDLGGLALTDFHLAPNERLGEAIARSWARLTSAWEAFSNERDGLQTGDHAGKLTRERWLLPLFSELGYGRLVQQAGVEIDGKTYAVFCEYNHSPIHLVGAGVSLDRRTAGVRGAADQSPHSVVQELLNRSRERLWGIVTNGLSLRLLRDNVTLTRQAYVEFDLEAMLATEAYEDFALLWLCTHQSRLEAEVPEQCWLERWTQAAQRDGTRALGELRSGVERAIAALGSGFLMQPANITLQAALRDGSLDGPGYYRELLRLIYRLLFLFVAEDRDALLLPDDGTPDRFDARERYDTYYATKRLRRLSVRRRGGRAHDVYEQIKLLSGWLRDGGQPVLALPPLGSALWDPNTTAHISEARLGNEAILEAIRELSYVEGGRRPVDFRHLGAEELGSVYESLLELHPAIDRETAGFTLTTAAGHERKQTGSYYTPTNLIGSLLETTLDPVIDAAVKSDEPEQALLNLTVCDPASGSGHFVIAAANRIAKRLAAVREGDPEPAPEAMRRALRDVVSRCIYAVDVNPMAVELCKVSLWLEALEPGRPLSFLDDRILCGNSLLGATPALIEAGIPDEAFRPLLGDDKDVCKAWRQHNARERKGQTTLRLDAADPTRDAATLAALVARQRDLGDDTLDDVIAQAGAYDAMVSSDEHERLCLAADAWVAAFATAKSPGRARLTTGVARRAALSGVTGLSTEELGEVRIATERYRPLHWHVAFPAVFRSGDAQSRESGWLGGFDCVLGNPPWERVKLQEKEFFAERAPDIADARTQAVRRKMIAALEVDDPGLSDTYRAAARDAEAVASILRGSSRYPTGAAGDINLYGVFAELAGQITRAGGRTGLVLKSGIVGDATYGPFVERMMEGRRLAHVVDFDNRGQAFPGIQGNVRFCLLTLASDAAATNVAAKLLKPEDASDDERHYRVTLDDLRAMSASTRTLPLVDSRKQFELLRVLHRSADSLTGVAGSWHGTPSTMIHMASGSSNFRTREQLESEDAVFECRDSYLWGQTSDAEWAPLLESKLIGRYNHRAATFDGIPPTSRFKVKAGTNRLALDSDAYMVPRYWVHRRVIGDRPAGTLVFRDAISATADSRSTVAAVVPPSGLGHTLSILDFTSAADRAAALALCNSIVFDYLVKQKVSGGHLTFGALSEIPVPARPGLATRYVLERVAYLLAHPPGLHSFVASLSTGKLDGLGPDRPSVQAELDAFIASAYGVDDGQLSRIIDSFDVLARMERAAHGEFRTQRLVLNAFRRL